MGRSTWSADTYARAATTRAATGASAFAYSDAGAKSAHPSLDPAGLGASGVRESRDSAAHPQSLAIGVFMDVTGSMLNVPRTLQEKLPALLGLLMRKGYATDPQILFGAIGDATCDNAPLQVGQFEAGNEMDTDLGYLLLEGGGGGGKRESYELALYFLARHTVTDCWDKRGKRGYVVIIGDEMAYPVVRRTDVQRFIGDTLQADIPLADIVAEVQQRYDVYYILPEGSSYVGDNEVLTFWRGYLGQNVIQLADLNAVCETIALTVGIGEDRVDLATGVADLADVGSAAAGKAVGTALATLSDSRATVAVTEAPPDLAGHSGNTRL